MNNRLKFYGPLIATNLLCLTYLLFFFYYNWLLSDYPTLYQAARASIAHEPRWITWGMCATGIGILLGIMSTIATLIALSTRDSDIFPDVTTLDVSPELRGIGIVVVLIVISVLIFNGSGNWKEGLRYAFEFLGAIVASPLFLITTLILIPTSLADIFMTLLKKS